MMAESPRRSARTVDPLTSEITEQEAPAAAPLPRLKPFLEFLQEHAGGEIHDELSETLNVLVRAVQAVGKAGTLTLKVSVKPAGRSHDQVFVVADVQHKLPVPEREESIFFVDAAGNLTRDNPHQEPLPGLRRLVRPALRRRADDGEDAEREADA